MQFTKLSRLRMLVVQQRGWREPPAVGGAEAEMAAVGGHNERPRRMGGLENVSNIFIGIVNQIT